MRLLNLSKYLAKFSRKFEEIFNYFEKWQNFHLTFSKIEKIFLKNYKFFDF